MTKAVIGVLNYNMPDMTDRLVARLKEIVKVPAVYIVLDNGSDRAKPAKTTTHVSTVNWQAVGGFNRLLELARAENPGYVWILTNDTYFEADVDPLAAMIAACESDTAIVHPAISDSKSANKWFAHMSRENASSGAREVERHIDYICPMFSRSFLDKINWRHTEKLISWGADIESCHYAWAAGMTVKICFDVVVKHELSKTIKDGMTNYNTPSEFYVEMQKNMSAVFRLKFGTDWQDRLTSKRANHKIIEWNPKIGALYKVFQGNEFFGASLQSIYNWVDNIVVVSSNVNWVGEAGNDCLDVVRAWKSENDFLDKIIIVDGHYTNQDDQQTAGWDTVRGLGLDYCMIIDSDEVYDDDNLFRFFEHVKSNPDYSAYCARNHTFIKSPFFMVYPDEPFRGVVMLSGRESGIQGARCARNQPMYLMDDVYFWHFNAVRRDEKIALKKFQTSLTGDGVKGFSLGNFYAKWEKLPEAENFHPHNGFEHWWKSVVLLKKSDLLRIVQNLPIIKQFDEPSAAEISEHNMRIANVATVMINQPLQALDTRPRLTIVIPAAGKGTRMKSKTSKPFLTAGGRYLIDWAIMSAATPLYRCHFVVIIPDNLHGINADRIIRGSVRDLHIGATVEIIRAGAVSQLGNVMSAASAIRAASELLIVNCDQFAFYSHSDFWATLHSLKIDGALICHTSDNPAYSYVETDFRGAVKRIVEKEVISNTATSGYYYWHNPAKFLEYAEKALSVETGREHYVSESYQMSVPDGFRHYAYVIQSENFHDMGTAEKLSEFENYVEKSKIYRKKLDMLIS